MKILLLTTTLVCATAVVANAETFTVTGTSQIVNQVTAMNGGRASFGAYVTGTGETVFAAGKKSTVKFSCMQWSAAPGSNFSSEGVCNNEDSGGAYSILFSCETSDCWGKLVGTSAGYANKTGTASWHTTGDPKQKTSTFSVTGQWN